MTTPQLPPARGLADLTTGTVLATVDVSVSRERVFQALTDPKELVKWWGSPEVYRTEDWRVDLKVGGHWEVSGHMADGRPFHVHGEFLVIEPPTRLVYTWHPDWFPGLATRLTYRLDPIPGGTRVTLRHEGFGERHDACRDHAQGWEQVLTWLAAYLNEKPEPRLSVWAQYLNPLRVATYLLILYAFAHTAGALFNTPHFSPEADTVLTAMRSVRFPASGAERTWFDFFFGFGLIDSVFFVASAAIAWFLGGRSVSERRVWRFVTAVLCLSYAASVVVIVRHFFLMPGIFSALITGCFALEWWLVSRPARARTAGRSA